MKHLLTILILISFNAEALVNLNYQGTSIKLIPINNKILELEISNLPYTYNIPYVHEWGNIRRNTKGDRLGYREFWASTTNSTSVTNRYYSKDCLELFPDLKTSNKFKLQLQVGELNDNRWVLEWTKLKCLESRWYIKAALEKKIYSFLKQNPKLIMKASETYDYYFKVWLNNLINEKGKKANLFTNSLSHYFRSRYSKNQLSDLLNSHLLSNRKLKDLSPQKYSNKTFSDHALFVTHATSSYDYKLKSKSKIDNLISHFSNKKRPIVFLVSEDKDETWFTRKRNVTETLYSRWGEHNYTVLNEVTVVGGQWKNCLRVTVVDLITRHFLFSNNHLTINLPAEAIYTEDGELLSKTIFNVDKKELIKQIERTSIFGGYRITIDDPHEGLIEVENDMNKYTGTPKVQDYTYDLYLKDQLIIENSSKGNKKIIFKIY